MLEVHSRTVAVEFMVLLSPCRRAGVRWKHCNARALYSFCSFYEHTRFCLPCRRRRRVQGRRAWLSQSGGAESQRFWFCETTPRVPKFEPRSVHSLFTSLRLLLIFGMRVHSCSGLDIAEKAAFKSLTPPSRRKLFLPYCMQPSLLPSDMRRRDHVKCSAAARGLTHFTSFVSPTVCPAKLLKILCTSLCCPVLRGFQPMGLAARTSGDHTTSNRRHALCPAHSPDAIQAGGLRNAAAFASRTQALSSLTAVTAGATGVWLRFCEQLHIAKGATLRDQARTDFAEKGPPEMLDPTLPTTAASD